MTGEASLLDPDLTSALARFAQCARVLVASDFDGTLAPIVEDPAAARPVPGAMDRLERLQRRPGVRVALVSGRALDSLRAAALPPEGLLLVGSHGAEVDGASGAALDGEARARLERVTDWVTRIVEAEGPGLSLEAKPTGLAFHYRNAAPEAGAAARDQVLNGPGALPGVQVKPGKMVVELSVVDVDKGVALTRLRRELGADAVFYVGDDVTDEHAFAALSAPDVALKVGDGETSAPHRVRDESEVLSVFDRLLKLRPG